MSLWDTVLFSSKEERRPSKTADDMVQVREVGRDADGMDIALAMARDLYQAAALAVRQGYSSPEERREVEALADIRCG